VAYGSSTSLNQLFDLVKSNLNSPLNPEYKAERKGDIKNSLANISKAKSLLGYEPLVNLELGMQLTIDWYKNLGLTWLKFQIRFTALKCRLIE
jgi:UDP-N-acetylglucosamine 4-epimerase